MAPARIFARGRHVVIPQWQLGRPCGSAMVQVLDSPLIVITIVAYFNNLNNTYFQGNNSGTVMNTTKIQETNIVEGPHLGGNFWASPDGNGFSQVQADADNDGICDVAYNLSNESIDYLPLAGSGVTN